MTRLVAIVFEENGHINSHPKMRVSTDAAFRGPARAGNIRQIKTNRYKRLVSHARVSAKQKGEGTCNETKGAKGFSV